MKRIDKAQMKKFAPLVAIGVGIILVIVLIVKFFTGGSSFSHFSKPEEKVLPPTYAAIAEGVPREYYTNVSFTSCITEHFTSCLTTHKLGADVPKIVLSGGFMDQVNTLASVSRKSEALDNCVGDSITSCSGIATKKIMDDSPSEAICETYTDEVLKKNCYNDIYPKIAIHNDDMKVCDKLTEVYYRNNCFDLYNTNKAIKGRDIGGCTRLSVDYLQENCKKNFWSMVAADASDIEFCGKNASTSDISACAIGYVNQKVNPKMISDCEIIKSYASYINQKEMVDSLVRQCVDRVTGSLLGTIISEGFSDSSHIEEYKDICNSLSLDTRKSECLKDLSIPYENNKTSNVPVIVSDSSTGAASIVSSGTISASGTSILK